MSGDVGHKGNRANTYVARPFSIGALGSGLTKDEIEIATRSYVTVPVDVGLKHATFTLPAVEERHDVMTSLETAAPTEWL